MTSPAALLASIPSPSSGAIHLGGLQLRMYGLMIALGVIAAVWLAGRRLEEKGVGTRDQMASIALWAVPAGIIGARLYHVITDWQLFRDDPGKIPAIWEGGLGIWGGIGLGVAIGVWRAHRLGIPLLPGLDAVVPALPLAQAIGRLGNWWNQELFGRPTTLPWALEIAPANRPIGYEQYATFHPTFLYEALWNLALMFLLIWVDKKGWLRPGRLILVYVAGYTFARFFIEGLRIDTANKVAGLRVNEWVSLVTFLVAVIWLVADVVAHRNDPREIEISDAETAGAGALVAAEGGSVGRARGAAAADATVEDANALVLPDGTDVGEHSPSPDADSPEVAEPSDPTPAPLTDPATWTGESAANRRSMGDDGDPAGADEQPHDEQPQDEQPQDEQPDDVEATVDPPLDDDSPRGESLDDEPVPDDDSGSA